MDVADTLRTVLDRRAEVRLAYLYGSRARGDAGPNSDVDLALVLGELPERPLGYRAKVAENLSHALDGARCDVVLLDEAPPELAFRVVKDGAVLICRDERERVAVEARIMTVYWDTAPLRDEYFLWLRRSIRDGEFVGGPRSDPRAPRAHPR